MARFVALILGASYACLVAAGLGVIIYSSTSLWAQQPMVPMQAMPVPPKTPATNAPAAVPPPDTFNRYGKIWAPSDDIDHPIKLNVQFPGVGDMNVPSTDELNVRDKLERLATLSDADIHKQLDQWPPYSKMKLGDQGQLLMRIQAFKDQRTKIALQKAHEMGLLTLTPEQKIRFEKEYWDKRLQVDRDLVKQFEPIFKAREQRLKDELFREFSAVSAGPVAQAQAPKTGGPKPPPVVAKPPVVKPPQPGVAPIAQHKPAPFPTPSSVGPTSTPPLTAQAPMQ